MKNYKFLNRMGPKYKMAAVLGLLLVFIASILLFLLLPTMNSIKETKKEIQAQRREVEREYEQRKQFGDISDKLKEMRSQLGLLNEPFVLESEKLEFITELERLAQENNVEQDVSLKTEDAQKRGFYRVVPLDIRTSGGFKDQMNYLVGLEMLGAYVNVHYLTLNSQKQESFEVEEGEKEDRNQIKMFISSRTYWAKEVGAADE